MKKKLKLVGIVTASLMAICILLFPGKATYAKTITGKLPATCSGGTGIEAKTYRFSEGIVTRSFTGSIIVEQVSSDGKTVYDTLKLAYATDPYDPDNDNNYGYYLYKPNTGANYYLYYDPSKKKSVFKVIPYPGMSTESRNYACSAIIGEYKSEELAPVDDSAGEVTTSVKPSHTFKSIFGNNCEDYACWFKDVWSWAMYIVLPLSALMIVWAGFLWMTSAGNPEKISKAKRIIVGVISGILLLVLARVFLVNIIGLDSGTVWF